MVGEVHGFPEERWEGNSPAQTEAAPQVQRAVHGPRLSLSQGEAFIVAYYCALFYTKLGPAKP